MTMCKADEPETKKAKTGIAAIRPRTVFPLDKQVKSPEALDAVLVPNSAAAVSKTSSTSP